MGPSMVWGRGKVMGHTLHITLEEPPKRVWWGGGGSVLIISQYPGSGRAVVKERLKYVVKVILAWEIR